MPIHTSIRIISIICVIVIKFLAPDWNEWISIAFSLGFAHYLLSIFYARRQFVRAFSQIQSSVMVIVLLSFGALLYLTDFSLVIFFGIHHVFNEVYLVNRSLTQEDNRSFTFYRTASIILNFFIYFVILRDQPGVQSVNSNILIGGLIVSYVVFAFSLSRIKKYLNGREFIDSFAFELIGLGLVILSYFVRIGFIEIVLYHFVFWVFYPMQKFNTLGKAHLVRYLGLTFACTALFLVLSPVGVFDYPQSGSIFYSQFVLWSYIHITSSFALSSAHPVWITRLFKPRFT